MPAPQKVEIWHREGSHAAEVTKAQQADRMSYVVMTYVKCPTCGWLHFAVSAEQAM